MIRATRLTSTATGETSPSASGARRRSPSLGRRVLALATATTATCGLALAAPAPALADHGINTTGDVNLRTGPGTQYGILDVVPTGSSPTYECWTQGENINSVDVWFKVDWNGSEGYISSFFDDSSYPNDADITSKYGIAPCNQEARLVVADPGIITDGSYEPYDRDAAVSWAPNNATSPQDFPAACTWFVSQALWAGGLTRDYDWTDEGGHGFLWSARPGTPTATAVQPFIEHLMSRFPASAEQYLNLAQNAVPLAQPGDIIAYDWDANGTFDHLSLVTSIASGSYPNVSEWGTLDFFVGHPSNFYTDRGWTWSEKNHEWLQQEAPAVTAMLIHIDTTTPSTY